MAIRTYLQGLGATHLFDLDNNGTLTTDDLGNSSTPTNISGGTYTFDTDPVCEGVTYSLDVVANTSSGTDGAIFTNVSGINTGITGWSFDKRSLLIWCKQADIQNPTCIYEQGGGLNNFALMGGALATFQAADSGQPFLIVQAKSLTQSDRPYCLVGVWEYHTQHAGSGNRVLFYINGILQGISELTGTDSFPNHVGDIQCGNSGDNLQSFAGTVFTSQTTEKNCNFLGMFNNVSLTQAQCREIFERTTFAKQTIVADTVANQQTALDAIIGTTYENENCAIRIIQATDATNYRLFIDNITFNADPNLEDISIQFVGTGTLTVENTNGTVIKYTSTPTEVETTSTTYTGGGSIVVVNNTKRVTTNQTITNPQDDKIVFDGSGTIYTIDGGIVPTIENVSGNTVTINLINNAPTPTLLETDGSFIIVDAGIINVTDGTTYTVDAEKKFIVDTDIVTSFTISGIIPKKIETTGTGSTTIIGINNAKLTTTTITGTGTLALGDGLNPSSNWSYSSATSTLTLNGTEADLSGLRGLAQVDYADAGGKIVYTFTDTTKIVISSTGDLTIDSDVEQMVCGVTPASGVSTLVGESGGRLQLGKAKNVGGFIIYSSGPALVFANDSSNALFTVADAWANFKLENGFRLDWYGGELYSVGLILPQPGSEFRTYSNEAVFVSIPSQLQSSRPEAYIRMQTTDQVIDGFVNKFGILLMIGKPTSFSGYEPISSGSAIDMSNQSTSSSFYDFEDLVAGKGNTRDIGGKHDTWVRLLNTNLGSNITVTSQDTNSGSDQKYLVENRKGVQFNFIDIDGNPIQGAIISMTDTDHGSRMIANQVGTNASYVSDRTYTGTSNALGVIDFSSVADSILLSVHWHSNTSGNVIYDNFDSRGNNNDTSDLFTFNTISYLHGITTVTLELKGVGTLVEEVVLVPDFAITDTNITNVRSYTELENSQKLYDRAVVYQIDNYTGESNIILARSGNQIELTNKTLVIDATASAVFDYSDPQITIKASTYTGGATATTGSVTTLNSALLSGGTFDCDVNYQSGAGTTLTNVTVNGVLDFDTAGTYTLDGCTISEVTNSSGGSITLSLTNGTTVTTNTGPNITLEQLVNITATNIIDGSRVQIYNVTKSAEIDNSVVSGGSGYSTSVNLLSASVDDGDTIRLRATYTSGTSAKSEALATGIIGITGLSFLTTQDDDTAYNTLALDGSTITKFTADYVNDEVDISVASDFTLAEFYAWWAYNLTTSQGIAEFFGGVTAVDEANFKINNTVVNIYLDNATATNISQTDNRRLYRADGARPVVSSTSGGGGIDVEWRSPVTIASSETIQTNLTSILADTDELQQNQGDWLTATGFSTFNHATDQVIVATNNDKTGYFISGTKTTIDDLNDPTVQNIVDGVWDEVLTGATHNDPTSAGRRLRQASAWLSAEGNLTGTPTTSTLPTDLTETTSSFYADQTMVIVSGSQAGQARIITNYDGTTKTITVEEPFTSAPSSGDEFAVFANHVHPVSQIQNGLATSAEVSALNDISEAQVKAQADQALIDADVDTKTNIKPSVKI